MNAIRTQDIDRFWANTIKRGECVEWLGPYKMKSLGRNYGDFYANGENYSAHRFSWILRNGRIPKGMFILHSCDNPPCVNPDHLRAGTPKDNVADSITRGTFLGGKKVAGPGLRGGFCKRGHNLLAWGVSYISKNTGRPYSVCKACARTNSARYWKLAGRDRRRVRRGMAAKPPTAHLDSWAMRQDGKPGTLDGAGSSRIPKQMFSGPFDEVALASSTFGRITG